VYQPRCLGDDGDVSSGQRDAHEQEWEAMSRSEWVPVDHVDGTTPLPVVYANEWDGPDDPKAALHPRDHPQNVGNTNYPRLHPQPPGQWKPL
jgi:hypothetical protein